MNGDYIQNDNWFVDRLKKIWPAFVAIVAAIIFIISSYYSIGTRVEVNADDIGDLKKAQQKNITLNENTLTTINQLKEQQAVIRENLEGIKQQQTQSFQLLQQIINILNR